LADRRDPAPLKRRHWIKEQGQKEWLWEINAADFFDCLSNQNTSSKSLCVSGSWTDHHNSEVETINISSALVNPETASALANAMRSCDDPFGFGFLHYSRNEEHFNNPPFELTQWIRQTENSGGRLDKFDPYAKEISYPPDKVVDSIAALLGLSADLEHREWRLKNCAEPSLLCEIWSNKNISQISERDEPFRSGDRIIWPLIHFTRR
jgi:hypothetical protein